MYRSDKQSVVLFPASIFRANPQEYILWRGDEELYAGNDRDRVKELLSPTKPSPFLLCTFTFGQYELSGSLYTQVHNVQFAHGSFPPRHTISGTFATSFCLPISPKVGPYSLGELVRQFLLDNAHCETDTGAGSKFVPLARDPIPRQ